MLRYNFIDEGEYSFFYYQENILEKEDITNLEKWLKSRTYKSGTCISGKIIPRKQLWFQEDNKYFCESWKYRYDRWKSNDYDDFLKEVQDKINEKVKNILGDTSNYRFNSCLINKYETGNDSIKPHKDTTESFGEYPIIAGLSVGEPRIFKIKKVIYDKNNKISQKIDKDREIEIELKNNSLIIMGGASQKYYTHEIPKMDTDKVRYSLTFRKYI